MWSTAEITIDVRTVEVKCGQTPQPHTRLTYAAPPTIQVSAKSYPSLSLRSVCRRLVVETKERSISKSIMSEHLLRKRTSKAACTPRLGLRLHNALGHSLSTLCVRHQRILPSRVKTRDTGKRKRASPSGCDAETSTLMIRDKTNGIGGTLAAELIRNSSVLVKALNCRLCRHSYETNSVWDVLGQPRKVSFRSGHPLCGSERANHEAVTMCQDKPEILCSV